MRVITNKTQKPIKIPLPGGKFLHLGPLKTAEVLDEPSGRDAERA